MKTYEFDVFLNGVDQITDDQADGLFEAGCADGTPVSSSVALWIHFGREASSLEDAIRSAIAQIRSVGFQVSKVELDDGSAALQSA